MSNSTGTGVQGDILVVDDTPANLQLLTKMLTVEGYGVRAVTSGAMALTVVHHSPPELILLDIRMPQMDGYEVCRKLKANPQTAAIPVIFLSALAETEDKANALKAGAVDYITKPFQIAEVIMRVKTHLTLRRLQQQLPVLPTDPVQQSAAEQPVTEKAPVHFLEDVTVLSANLVNCTALTKRLSPIEFLSYLNQVFAAFDQLVERYRLVRISAIGAEYKVVSSSSGTEGKSERDPIVAIADLALAMQQVVTQFQPEAGTEIHLKVGIALGSGVVSLEEETCGDVCNSHRSPIGELSGTAVDLAELLQHHGKVGQIQTTANVFARLQGKYIFEAGQSIEVQGVGEIKTFCLSKNTP
jgi:adenylate cyclase